MRNFAEVDAREVAGVCLQCHDRGDHANWATNSVHAARGVSCVDCHQIHHEGRPPDKLLLKGTELDTCRNCHLRKIANLARSSHMPVREESITCTSCHNPHGGPGPSMLLQYSINENCYTCHAEKRSPKIWEHAPVREECTLCHDPHGSLHAHLLKAKIPRLCQQCHDVGRHPTNTYVQSSQLLDPPDPDSWFPRARTVCTNCHVNIHGSSHPAGARLLQ
jgi:DmsE family decaheme c-type cytochrome